MTIISIEVRASDLSELIGKKLIGIEGDDCSLSLTFEDEATLNICGNDGYNYPATLDLELSYAYSDDR